jgi:hypothetical protein
VERISLSVGISWQKPCNLGLCEDLPFLVTSVHGKAKHPEASSAGVYCLTWSFRRKLGSQLSGLEVDHIVLIF